MTDSTVANLTPSDPLVGTELFYADNGSNDVNVTAKQIKDFVFYGVMKLGQSTNPTPTDGDLWYDGTHLYFQQGSTTVTLA
jgi:hypothetical protein